MDSPEILSWAEIQKRLTQILDASPRNEYLKNPDPCIQRIIRLRDIANYCQIERQEVYRARRGERSLKPNVQQLLSWFFWNLDKGRLLKEKSVDGKWRIVYQAQKVPAHAAYAGSPAITATVDFLSGKLKLQ